MAPVILKMDVHCLRCARKIRNAVLRPSAPGVHKVLVSADTGLVVVSGAPLDASLLRWRIQSRTGKPVAVVSDGGAQEEPAGQMVHLGPTPPYGYGYGGYGGGWPAPALQQYVPGGGWPAPALQQYVPGGGSAFPYEYDARQYGMMMANDAPACCRDDGPSGCCTMQ